MSAVSLRLRSGTTPRAAYLAYQAEIGTEEVILPKPWIRPQPQKSPQAVPAKPSQFFQSAQTVNKSAIASKEIPQATAIATIPEFKDLDAYWKYLEEEYPKWFTSAIPLARAEGFINPVLAVVELSPTLSNNPKVFDGEVGLLLDKMTKAIHLQRNQLYLTSVMKTPPSGGRSWPRKDIARMLPAFFQELRLAGCSWVLLMGEACAQTVLRRGSNLDALRQQPMEAEGVFFAATNHPIELQNNEELKRKAWKDLQWLQPRLGIREAR